MPKSELLAQAEALEWVRNSATTWSIAATLADVRERITELRAQAAAMPDEEPVAWLHEDRQSVWVVTDRVKQVASHASDGRTDKYTIPLYTAPPDQSAKIARMRELLEMSERLLRAVHGIQLADMIRAELEKP